MSRVPVSCAWRGLVAAGDRPVRWDSGKGSSSFLSAILAAHVTELLTQSHCRPRDTVVLAIPDALDEFGQDALLRDLRKAGFGNIQLLWRPVAAALSWLSAVDQNNAFAPDMDVKEHILVVCLGPDGVEMTPFRLHREQCENGLFVIPVRDRPREIIPLTGFDWAANIFQSAMPGLEIGAFWQVFMNFPHIWESMAQRPLSEKKIWSRQDQWRFWHPGEMMGYHVPTTSARPNHRLRKLLGKSCHILNAKSIGPAVSSQDDLSNLFKDRLQAIPGSRLRGVIISGPLCPQKLPGWIFSADQELREAGIKKPSQASPQIDSVWLAHDQNIWGHGCAEYALRLDRGEPTYVDTLPNLSMLVERRGEHFWLDLVKAATCKGGVPYKPESICGKFAIKAGGKRLQVYLRKDQLDGGRELEWENGGEQEPFPGIDQKITLSGSYDSAITLYREKYKEEDHDGEVLNYIRKLSDHLFGNPFRRVEFSFPSVAHKDISLDLNLEIRPASGLARIELYPSNVGDRNFLRGGRILMDYATMRITDPPPSPKLGWPPLKLIKVDPDASFLNYGKIQIQQYLNTPVCREDLFGDRIFSVEFEGAVDEVKKILTEQRIIFVNGERIILSPPIDQDGCAGNAIGSVTIDRVATKVENDYHNIPIHYERKFLSRMSWLFAKTPDNLKRGIRQYLSSERGDGRDWLYMVDAAARSFTSTEEFEFLYAAILKKINTNHGTPFPINSSRALLRLLTLRKNSPLAMKRKEAKVFTEKTVEIMEQESKKFSNNQKKYPKFFQAALLFLYLLRFRMVDQSFLDGDNPEDRNLFNRAIKCLRTGQCFFSQQNIAGDTAEKIVTAIELFIYYEGSDLPADFYELTSDEEEEEEEEEDDDDDDKGD
ncbi:hypothetical protein [Desulfocicer vacuolatum]|nr:hypothetical protein [Desulfocicer vacuolatum]